MSFDRASHDLKIKVGEDVKAYAALGEVGQHCYMPNGSVSLLCVLPRAPWPS